LLQWAELPDSSDEIHNATNYGPFCLQNDWYQNNVVGDEDCLFINVYTTQVDHPFFLEQCKLHFFKLKVNDSLLK
jgi:hypothetical protein